MCLNLASRPSLHLLGGGVHGVVVPFLERDDGQLRAVLNEDFDVFRDDGGALVVQDDDRLGELLRDDHDVLRGSLGALPGQQDADLAVHLDLGRDGDDGGLGEVLPGVRGDAVLGDGGGADPAVVAADGLNPDAVRSGDAHGRRGTAQDLGVQAAEALERGEPPVLFHAGQRLEVRQLVGGQAAGA